MLTGRILVAEGDPQQAKVLTLYLEREGDHNERAMLMGGRC